MMRIISLLLLLMLLCVPASAEQGMVVKVTTEKGPLWLRAEPSAWSRGIAQIPNGTCLLLTEEGEEWHQVAWNGQSGYCSAQFLTVLREADLALLDYHILRLGDSGAEVEALKVRLQELGYIRAGAELNASYNDILKERIILFQRETGMTETGIASQELQMYLFSEKAPRCTQDLPEIRSANAENKENVNRVICGCCWGEGCECCNGTGWIYY